MTTLLLCFFVFLLVTAKVDVDKLSAASGYMAHKMGLLPANTRNDSKTQKEDAEKGVKGDEDQTLSIDEGMKLLLGGKDMFRKGEATPVYSTKAIQDLNTFMNQIRGLRNIVEVRGHTSTDETEGTIYLDSMDLATERARAIRKYMIEVGKIKANRIRVVGCGEHEPIKTNLHVEKSENRRVEIRVTAKLQSFNSNTKLP
jgi:flagellar motor protein MotB